MSDESSPIVVGRSCGTCTLCCKILAITELKKPQGVWCSHCKPGRGCLIYSDRPTECRTFHCGYLTQVELGDEWKPDHSKIVLVAELDGNRIAAHVDPQRPDAWRREPYYSTFKEWAESAVPYRGQIVACVGRHMYMIFPDRDVDLGIVSDDQLIVTGERTTSHGIVLEAFKISKDDPRAKTLVPQHWAKP
jgi:hypothetical protein